MCEGRLVPSEFIDCFMIVSLCTFMYDAGEGHPNVGHTRPTILPPVMSPW